MKIKTAELTGAALDWAVAKCLGIRVYIGRYEHTMTGPCLLDADLVDMNTDGPQELKFSRDWAQGGPIIEQAGIALSMRYGSLQPNHVQDVWDALIKPEFYSGGRPGSGVKKEVIKSGPTPLSAAMRCFCCSKLGEEIDVPEELLK